jgi:hypothetical protein
MSRFLARLNTPMALLTVLVLLMAIDCYLLFFRWYSLSARTA